MDVDAALKHISDNIKKLEAQIYNFELVAIPRYNTDKDILTQMRQDLMKLGAFKEKQERGEKVSIEEAHAAIPPQFR
jgi:hypothetical protein